MASVNNMANQSEDNKSTTPGKTPFLELPWVGFEPTTLCPWHS